MSKRIIRLTESQLERVIKVITEEEEMITDIYDSLIKSVKPAKGGQYCFTRTDVNSIYKESQYNSLEGFKRHYKLQLVKQGDTYNKLEDGSMAATLDDLNRSKGCGDDLRKKKLTAGDVLLVSTLPGS